MPMMQQMMQMHMQSMYGQQQSMQMQMGQMMQMMQMMQAMMAQTASAGGGAGATGGTSPASAAYMAAMNAMHGPMMQGAQAADPDVAFVRSMIPHHQAAIDMAKAVIQYGKDPQVRDLAGKIISAQQAEISQMQDWLKQRPYNPRL
jgi:uncharacterized protein (DUF305 family)